MEQELHILWPRLHSWRYLRETKCDIIPGERWQEERHHLAGPGTATIAYATEDGKVVRYFWLLRPGYVDGVDPSPVEQDYRLVHPQSIALDKKSRDFNPAAAHDRYWPLRRKPPKLLERWQKWEMKHKPRIIRPPSRWRKYWLRVRATVKRFFRAS